MPNSLQLQGWCRQRAEEIRAGFGRGVPRGPAALPAAVVVATSLSLAGCVLSTTAKVMERTATGGTIAYRNYADAEEARAAIRALMQCPDSYEFVSERPNHSWRVVTYRCVDENHTGSGGSTDERESRAGLPSSGQRRIVEGAENRCAQGDSMSCLQAGRYFVNRDEKARGMRLLVLACAGGEQAEACEIVCADQVEAAKHQALCATACNRSDGLGCQTKQMEAQDQ